MKAFRIDESIFFCLKFRQENEKVYLHRKLNDEWYYGKNRRGCEGMFPSSYINVIVPIRESSSTKKQQSQAVTSTPIQKSVPTARALYSFAAEAPEDLSLQVNHDEENFKITF